METCELKCEQTHEGGLFRGKDRYRFWVKVVGPTGTSSPISSGEYDTGHTGTYIWQLQNFAEAVKLVDGLRSRLLADGWYEVGRGEAWFNYRYRRGI
jgi:hypothetical protein